MGLSRCVLARAYFVLKPPRSRRSRSCNSCGVIYGRLVWAVSSVSPFRCNRFRSIPMRCPTCDSVITHNTGVCSHCETQFVPKRVRLDSTDKDFYLKADEDETQST